jgi:hypothetical protein
LVLDGSWCRFPLQSAHELPSQSINPPATSTPPRLPHRRRRCATMLPAKASAASVVATALCRRARAAGWRGRMRLARMF